MLENIKYLVPLVDWLSAVKLDTSLVVERGEALGVSRADKALKELFDDCRFNLNNSSTSVGKLISSISLRFEFVSHVEVLVAISDRAFLMLKGAADFLLVVSSNDRRPASSLKNSIKVQLTTASCCVAQCSINKLNFNRPIHKVTVRRDLDEIDHAQ